jgi:hypothetical protein
MPEPDEAAYGDGADLRKTLEELRELRSRLAAVPGRKPATAREFYSALRLKSPELPEVPIKLASHPDELPWPDNCAEWAYIALECYGAAIANADAGDSAGSVFHEAEGDYCLSQATACIQFGF